MSEKNKIEQLLDRIYHIEKASDEAKARLAHRFAPDFNLFDFLRKDEAGVSNVIAFLLNPQGKHGQGDLFLRLFCRQLQIKDCDTTAAWEISTEKQANGRRRIDIYLESKNAILAVENKPWAADQEKQLEDYADFIQHQGKANWWLIYLCKHEPTKESISDAQRKRLSESGNFLWVDFYQAAEWLDKCAIACRAASVRAFIEHFVSFIRIHVNGDINMSDTQELVGTILSNDASIETAFLISSLLPEVKKNLLQQFREDLEHQLKEKNMTLIWDETLNQRNPSRFTGFGVMLGDVNDDLYFRLEFEGADLWQAFLGLAHIKKDDKKFGYTERPDHWNLVNQLMAERYPDWRQDNGKKWVGYLLRGPFFEPYGRDFGRNSQFWIDIKKDGGFSQRFVALALEIKELLSSADKLALLAAPKHNA